ncbi:MAG: helix-turn-helix transcriptional regulator [Synergistaceae bacterium]|nr:helix-turn-helix transcriptional regulator [Synergistaceae bacterium]MBR0204181.1 helix-turn-helix transcriptional regulator [Synergistaceae bacterium]
MINTKKIKHIMIDEPVKKFLSELRNLRIDKGLGLREAASFMGIFPEVLSAYERGCLIPSLSPLMKLCEFYDYDLSDSINYRFYHGKIHACDIKATLRSYGIELSELAALTGYHKNKVCRTIGLADDCSLPCLAAVFDVIQHERNALKFRNELCRR